MKGQRSAQKPGFGATRTCVYNWPRALLAVEPGIGHVTSSIKEEEY